MKHTYWNVVEVLFMNEETRYPHATVSVLATCVTYPLAQQILEDRINYLTETGGENANYEYIANTYNAYQLEHVVNGAILQLSIEPSNIEE